MKHVNYGVILLALLFVVMAMVPMVTAEINSGILIAPSSQDNDNATAVGNLQRLPAFRPGINDKLSYNEEMGLIKNYTPSPSVPESEIVQVIFSKAWFLQNNNRPKPDQVEVTFPKKWVNSPNVKTDEAVVMLRIPKKMLELDNTNPDSGMITVSYPVEMFEEFSNLNEKTKTLEERRKAFEARSSRSDEKQVSALPQRMNATATTSIDKQVRAWYQRDTAYTVTKVIGMMNPTSYSNSGGESFRNYDEREIYLDRSGDAIEFITDFTRSGNTYAWVAVYDEGTWSTAWNWLNIDITGSLRRINYHFYITNGVYDLWLQDNSSGTWYHNSYSDTDNPSTRVNWLVGSTEVDTVGGVSNYFKTETNPIRDESTYSGSSWYSPQTTFDWNSYTSDDQYVYINAWFDSSGYLNTQHIAGQNY